MPSVVRSVGPSAVARREPPDVEQQGKLTISVRWRIAKAVETFQMRSIGFPSTRDPPRDTLANVRKVGRPFGAAESRVYTR